jgi:prephenate dehydrogenase
MTNGDNISTGRVLGDLRLGIVGLGLMGGSLALALRGQVASLLAVERLPDVRQAALRQGIVDVALEALTPDAPPVDLLVLATPVRVILDMLHRLPALRPEGCAVIDLGSTKRAVMAAMDALPPAFAALGGHPMCGKETAGLASATADLFRGQTFVLCPGRRTSPALEATIMSLVSAVGARPLVLDAAEHDRLVAAVSHLPALVASALMRAVPREQQWTISASGFRDTSRLAGSDPRMMLDILLTNRQAILDALTGYESELTTVRAALMRGDETALAEWLAGAQVGHAAYRRHVSGEHLLSSRAAHLSGHTGKLPDQ